MHRHRLAFDDLGACARLVMRCAGRQHVHVVAAGRQAGGEALGEPRGAVHVRRESVCADQHREGSTFVRLCGTWFIGTGIVGRLGRGHGMLVAYLCAGAGRTRSVHVRSQLYPSPLRTPWTGPLP